jgi:uncharacterized protein YqeY
MTFKKIQSDMYAAMKAKDTLRKDVLSNLLANAKKTAIDNGEDRENISDATMDATILKEKKLLSSMIETFPAAATSQTHLALKQSYIDKLAIVMEYAPQIIDDPEQIKELALKSGIPLEKKNMGKIMGMLKANKCDMGIASCTVNEMLTAKT